MAREQEWKEVLNKRLESKTTDRIRYLENEHRRRRRNVDDEFREELMDKFQFGETAYSHIPIAEPWQKTHFNLTGKLHGEYWHCPRCGTKYHTGYPPIGGCQACKQRDGKYIPTPIDDNIRLKAYRR